MPTTITKQDAIDVARNLANEKGWSFNEENAFVCRDTWDASDGLIDAWFVTTNPNTYWIANVHVVVDANDLSVIHCSHRPNVVSPIPKEQAIATAKDHAVQQGWPWNDELEIFEDECATDDARRNCWSIHTNPTEMGGNVDIAIDAESGEVIHGIFIEA